MTEPAKTVLFSGHMTDAPDRAAPRFPADKVPQAQDEISAILRKWGVRSGDLCICGGARGGDILFAEACLELGARLEIVLALPVDAFLEASVQGEPELNWPARFERLSACAHVVPAAPADPYKSPFADCNARMIARALKASQSPGQGTLHILLLWDGKGGDGPGGTADFARRGDATGAEVHIIDPANM